MRIIDNLLSQEQCEEIITFVHVLNQDMITMPSMSFNDDPFSVNPIEYDFESIKYQSMLWEILPEYIVNLNFKVLEYIKGCRLSLHTDSDYPDFPWSILVYLNTIHPDDGGVLFFDDGVEVNSIQGRAVIFKGSEVKHGVTELLGGERYVLTGWMSQN